MRNETREKFNAYLKRVAEINRVPDTSKHFNVSAQGQQTVERKIKESSAFLSLISIVGRDNQQGQIVGVDFDGMVASNTDTSDGETRRQPANLYTSTAREYNCQKTNYDTFLPYTLLDEWAHQPEFLPLLSAAIIEAQARSRIKIGFNGIARAPNSNRATNPLGQDVARGWLQYLRDEAPERVMSEVVEDSGQVTVGKTTGDYKTLDGLVQDAINSMIHEAYQDDIRLRVICGRGLLHDKYFQLIEASDKATEKVAADILLSTKNVGGLPAIRVPWFPANSLLITMPMNLEIDYQRTQRRRMMKEEPEFDRVANYESSNDDYVVRTVEAACLIENIELVD